MPNPINDLCQATIKIGGHVVKCSLVVHDGQHFALGYAQFDQPTPEMLMQRTRRIGYRLAWHDKERDGQELNI